MPQPTLKPTDPWAAMDALVKITQEPMGPECFTIYDYAKRYNRCHSTARLALKKMTRDGLQEEWSGRFNESGKAGHKYRLKP